MINDAALIKFVRARGHKTDWPEVVITMRERIREMKLGFPGIGNNHLTLVPFNEIESGEIFIYDPFIFSEVRGDEAPMMLKYLGNNRFYIEGIGCGLDSVRDPDRINFRYGDVFQFPFPSPDFLVSRVDVRPTMNGGPGYYYFFKAYRDMRY